MDELVLSQ